MGKIEWKPGNMLYPLPVVMVTVADEAGNDNIITVACLDWGEKSFVYIQGARTANRHR